MTCAVPWRRISKAVRESSFSPLCDQFMHYRQHAVVKVRGAGAEECQLEAPRDPCCFLVSRSNITSLRSSKKPTGHIPVNTLVGDDFNLVVYVGAGLPHDRRRQQRPSSHMPAAPVGVEVRADYRAADWTLSRTNENVDTLSAATTSSCGAE